jgi:hypothetical protein
MKSKKSDKISFQLVSITTDEFATFKENYDPEKKGFEINLDLDIRVNDEQKIVGMFTRIIFEQKSKPVLLLKSGCHFQLDPAFWESQTADNMLNLPVDLLTHFLVIAVGTARGIVHAKKPAWLSDIILPTLNVSTMIKEDIQFNLQELEEE